MEHVVFFPGADGAQAFSRAADLDEAVRIVERLRNDNGVGDVSVFALHPVPLAFRTYVHVELTPTEEPVLEADPAAEVVEIAVEAPAIETFDAAPAQDETSFDGAEPVAADDAPVEPEPVVAEHDEPVLPDTFEVEAYDVTPVDAEPAQELADVEQEPASEAAPVEAEQQESFEVEQGESLEAAPVEQHELTDVAPVDAYDVEHGEVSGETFEVAPEPVVAAEPSIPPPPPAPPTDFVLGEGDWTHPEAPVEAFEAAAAPVEELYAEGVASESIPVPVVEQSPSELPPLTLAPGPLLFDGDVAPATHVHQDVVEAAAPVDLPALVPADFNDLIPSDLVHGDLARPVDEVAAVEPQPEPVADAVLEAPVEAPYEVPVADAPVAEVAFEAPVEPPYEAPPAEALPPLDVEVPADASSLEALPPIPAAREVAEQPVAARRDGPRGLGYFGG